ncbi:hypothetical protein Scep_007406 [Stephania cephalantha]|uniref:Uncharacterized protein n=1 Tax=Stephania cephalantha TaxID=152367 RepID=A0AAP0KBI8_9MAGN
MVDPRGSFPSFRALLNLSILSFVVLISSTRESPPFKCPVVSIFLKNPKSHYNPLVDVRGVREGFHTFKNLFQIKMKGSSSNLLVSRPIKEANQKIEDD